MAKENKRKPKTPKSARAKQKPAEAATAVATDGEAKEEEEEGNDERSDDIEVRFEFGALGEVFLPRVSKVSVAFAWDFVLSGGGRATVCVDETGRGGDALRD